MTLATLLAEGRPLLADGAVGSNLFALGLPLDEPPEHWNAEHPDRIVALHRAFVAAGADLILTNSFGANARRLKRHGRADQVSDCNILAARHARAAVAEAGRPVIVAGSVGPTGERVGPDGPVSEEDARVVFAAQIAALAAGGVDLVWIETMSSLPEIRAAAAAAVTIGLPYALLASFGADGRTSAGLGPGAFVASAAALAVPPLAVGANCGVGPVALLASVTAIRQARPGLAVIAKASAGLPRVVGGHLHYPATPAVMATYARSAADAGVRIIGGCCGTTPAHLAAMRDALRARREGERKPARP